jgi:hypothetical protein
VAEWPDGKELEDGVFIRGAISASQVKGLARSKRYLAPSATVQEPATAAQGTSRFGNSSPVKRKAAKAKAPQRNPAVPTTVKKRSTTVSGFHLRPNTARKAARSRSLTLPAKPFKTLHSWFRPSGGHCRRRGRLLLPLPYSKVE